MNYEVKAIPGNPHEFCEAELDSRHIQTLFEGSILDNIEEIMDSLCKLQDGGGCWCLMVDVRSCVCGLWWLLMVGSKS